MRPPAEGAVTALGTSKISSAGDAVACTLFEITAHRPAGGESLHWLAILSVTPAAEERLPSPPLASFRPSKRALAGIWNGADGIGDRLLLEVNKVAEAGATGLCA